jgi:hypothetical protein
MYSGGEVTSAEEFESIFFKGIIATSNIPEISKTAKNRLLTRHPSILSLIVNRNITYFTS